VAVPDPAKPEEKRTPMSFVEILIADDHDGSRRAIQSVIDSEKAYRVCGEARDGIDAVDKVRRLHPDIVLMDINMPRMGGLQATEIIRREIPDCNVIIVTQNEATIAREQAMFRATLDGDGAHAAHEHILISDIARRGALLAGLIAAL
jgi:DNA-binding NarL/FixJ family response regulator